MNLYLQHLEEQLKEDFNFLKEYEEKLRHATDPREKRRYGNEIQELKQQISEREAEIQREIERVRTSNTTSSDGNNSQPAFPNFAVYRKEEWVGREKETNDLLKSIRGSCRVTVVLGITGI